MNTEMEIKSKIRFQERATALGGVIGEAAHREISSLVCKLYNCPAGMLALATKYANEKVSVQHLIQSADNDYDNAPFRCDWFGELCVGGGITEASLHRKADRWFLETTMRLIAEDYKRERYISPYDIDNISVDVHKALLSTVRIEREVIFQRYDRDGREVMTAEEVAKLPLINCNPDYIAAIFEELDNRFEEAGEDYKKSLIGAIHDITELMESVNTVVENITDYDEDVLPEDVIKQILAS